MFPVSGVQWSNVWKKYFMLAFIVIFSAEAKKYHLTF